MEELPPACLEDLIVKPLCSEDIFFAPAEPPIPLVNVHCFLLLTPVFDDLLFLDVFSAGLLFDFLSLFWIME